jgi:hypothetical protein
MFRLLDFFQVNKLHLQYLLSLSSSLLSGSMTIPFIHFLWACLRLHPTSAAWENGAFFHKRETEEKRKLLKRGWREMSVSVKKRAQRVKAQN